MYYTVTTKDGTEIRRVVKYETLATVRSPEEANTLIMLLSPSGESGGSSTKNQASAPSPAPTSPGKRRGRPVGWRKNPTNGTVVIDLGAEADKEEAASKGQTAHAAHPLAQIPVGQGEAATEDQFSAEKIAAAMAAVGKE
ncbi:MAG: hypothetical protein WAN50_03035 [Minisyncoccia bacterium]